MIKRFLVALVLVALIGGGLVGFNLFRSQMIADFFANQRPPAVTVSTVEIEPVTWTPHLDAIGTLIAAQGVDVAGQTAGVVRSIAFEANDQVEAGELLVQIEDTVERADLLSAQAAVERDRAAFERAQQLRSSGVSSEAALEDAQSALAASESTLARLQATIDLKAIEAPFAGTIGIPRIDVGEYVQPGTMVATLQQLDTMQADFTVPEQRMGDIELGQTALFGLTEGAFPYQGRITGIDPKIDPQTRLISVRAEVANPDGELRPGQFVRVRVQQPPIENVIAAPQTAVVTSLYGDHVYVVGPRRAEEPQPDAEQAEDAEAGETVAAAPARAAEPEPAAEVGEAPPLEVRQVFVTTGRRSGNLVEIVDGLEAGQVIVTAGQNRLSSGTPVAIDNSVNPAQTASAENVTP